MALPGAFVKFIDQLGCPLFRDLSPDEGEGAGGPGPSPASEG